jgi:type I restriction enzyme S subunit
MMPNKYLPSHLGEIPNDWQRVALSDVMSVRQGLQIAISKRLKVPTNTSKEYITIQSIKKTEQLREYVEAPTKRVICNREDVLMTRTGNTGIVVTDVEGIFHNNFFLMDFDRQRIDKVFLVNYLRSPRVQHLILTKAGASTIPDLNHKDFYSIEFPLGPLPEQRKIASILRTWDKAISTTERLIDNSKQQKKALMQQLLTCDHTQRKRLLDDSGKPFKGEWEAVKLSDVADIVMGSSPKSSSYNEISEGLPLIQGNADIKNRKSAPRIYTSEVTKKCGIDDILLSVRAPVGTVAKSIHEACIGRGISAIKAKKENSQNYIYQFLLWFEKRWDKYSQGSTFEAVNSNDIKSLHLLIPSFLEQQKIASVLTNADNEIELLEQQLADLKQEKKALMQQLLTGKRRVKINDTEAA